MTPTHNHNISLKISWLAQLSGVIGFFVWSFAALFSPMLFSGEPNWQTWFLFITFIAMPVTILLASAMLWVSYKRNAQKAWQVAAFWLLATPWPLILFQ